MLYHNIQCICMYIYIYIVLSLSVLLLSLSLVINIIISGGAVRAAEPEAVDVALPNKIIIITTNSKNNDNVY